MNEYKKKTEYNQTKRRIFMKWKIYISPENVVATTYKSFFSDFEIANDKIRELLFVIVAHSDAFINLFFAFGSRPILHAHDLHR